MSTDNNIPFTATGHGSTNFGKYDKLDVQYQIHKGTHFACANKLVDGTLLQASHPVRIPENRYTSFAPRCI
jgi:hypothetical protein